MHIETSQVEGICKFRFKKDTYPIPFISIGRIYRIEKTGIVLTRDWEGVEKGEDLFRILDFDNNLITHMPRSVMETCFVILPEEKNDVYDHNGNKVEEFSFYE